MTNALARTADAGIVENVVVNGDLSKLKPDERVAYYRAVCDSLGLNPLTKPFDYITLNGKLTLYARRDATDQLRKLQSISVELVNRDIDNDLGICVVEVEASTPEGRKDFATGIVSIKNASGDNLANAIMKAETKAKRRATLSICGLGWMDETETVTVKDARPVVVTDTGEIVDGEIMQSPTNGNGKQTQPPSPMPEEPHAQPAKAQPAANGTPTRPYTPEQLPAMFAKAAAGVEARGLALGPDDFAILTHAIDTAFETGEQATAFLKHATGISYIDDMTETQCVTLLRMLKPSLNNGTWLVCEDAEKEIAAVLQAQGKAA